MKLGPLQTAWIAALRSGKYKQTTTMLYDGHSYCCLGVACAVLGLEPEQDDAGNYRFDGSKTQLPQSAINKLNYFTSCHPDVTPIGMNDDRHWSFAQIASAIESNPQDYFSGPA